MGRLTFDGLFCDIAMCKETPGGTFCENGSCSQRKVWERLKEYEDMEELGRLVVLPCKPGDTVYKICPISRFIEIGDRWDGRIVETDCQRCAYYACDCHNIGYNKEARNVVVERRMSKPEQIVRCMPYFGTIYFLAREEAERALEGQR